ncbi:MAG: hypothetical protein U9M94_01115 [Patescibacteria group bacterium]|nr:hypothetical protein [Patescibacteria group bacterium]
MQKSKNKFMLSKLFGSTARVKILKLFLLHPNEKYYIRQLARDLSLQLNSVRRELDNLETFGILTSNLIDADNKNEELTSVEEFLTYSKTETRKEKKNNNNKSDKKYYQVNTNFVLHEEIRALIVKAQLLYEKDFVEKLQIAGRPKLLILTGLFVNDDNAQVDLLVVGRLNKSKLIKQINNLEKELGLEVNFTIMDLKEFKYRRDITDVFLYEILEGKKLVVIDELSVGTGQCPVPTDNK